MFFDSTTKRFFDDPLKFLQKRSLCPPDGVDGYLGSERGKIKMDDFASTGSTAKARSEDPVYKVVTRDHRVAYAELYVDRDLAGIQEQKDLKGRITSRRQNNVEGIDVVRMRASYAEAPHRRPIYFLPWDTKGAIVRLRIPPKGSVPGPDPDIFITAAINGCSVFVQGDPTSPTVYHAGGDTGQSDHNQAARYWRDMLHRIIDEKDRRGGFGQVMAEVNKTHYIKTPGTTGNMSTPTAERHERELKARLARDGRVTLTFINPWGCVMGIRRGDRWSFYLQENGTVICQYATKHKVEQRSYARPLALREIYPTGTRIAELTPSVPMRMS